MCSTFKDLSIDVSITNVGMTLSKLGWLEAIQHKSKYNSKLNLNHFWKEKLIYSFPWCSTRKDLYIYESFTTVGLILTSWGDLKTSVQVKIQFQTFLEENDFFLCWITYEDLSIDVSITTVGLILTKLEWFLFSGNEDTRFHNPHMETCRHKNFSSSSK